MGCYCLSNTAIDNAKECTPANIAYQNIWQEVSYGVVLVMKVIYDSSNGTGIIAANKKPSTLLMGVLSIM